MKILKYQNPSGTLPIIDLSKSPITREQYIDSQRNAIISNALQNSLSRTMPAVPMTNRLLQTELQWNLTKEQELSYWRMMRDGAPDDKAYQYADSQVKQWESAQYVPNYEFGPGLSCIYTALDNYGKKYRVPGNLSFLADPGKYGFKEISVSDLKPGDLVQHNKNHAMIFDSYDPDGLPLYNYSRGGDTAQDIVKRGHYYHGDLTPENGYKVFRFIGNADDNNQWEQEYNNYRREYGRQSVEQLRNVPQLNLPKLIPVPQPPALKWK